MPLRPLRSRLEPRAVYLGIEYHVAGRRFHHSDRRPHLCHDLGGPDPKGTYHTDENVRGTAWYMRSISLILQSTQGSNQASSLGGNLLITVSGFMYSIYLVVSKPLTLKYSSVTMMKWMFLFSTLITLPFAIESIWNTPAFHKEVFDGQELGAIFFVLFGATFVPYLLIPLALKRIRPTTVSMYNYIQPIVASFIAVFIGQDSFSVTKLVSAALVFSGVYLVTQSKSRADLEQQNSQSFSKNACNMKNNA